MAATAAAGRISLMLGAAAQPAVLRKPAALCARPLLQRRRLVSGAPGAAQREQLCTCPHRTAATTHGCASAVANTRACTPAMRVRAGAAGRRRPRLGLLLVLWPRLHLILAHHQ